MKVFGVTDHRFLGGAGRWRDSGMMGEPSNDRADCFWRADLLEAAAELVSVIRETRPQVLVTYDSFGGYGHPDHIQAHRVATYAADLAGAPAFRPDLGEAWAITKVYWQALPRSYVSRGIDALIASGQSGFFGVESADELPFLTPDELVTTHLGAPELEPVKMAALREHATQVTPEHGFFQMAALIGPDALGNEFFSLVRGELGPDVDADGREVDLFSGVA
jgi:N-acetyl-1-D-myo-inositol-2-amino-2-deoxy-alpha-D-glucopyranoside deacetylase